MIHVSETGRNEQGERVFALDENQTVLGRAYVYGNTILRVEVRAGGEHDFNQAFLLRSVVFALCSSEPEIRTAFTDDTLVKLGFSPAEGGMLAKAAHIQFHACCHGDQTVK